MDQTWSTDTPGMETSPEIFRELEVGRSMRRATSPSSLLRSLLPPNPHTFNAVGLLLLFDIRLDIVDDDIVDDDNNAAVLTLIPELRVEGLINPNEWVNSDVESIITSTSRASDGRR